ncbi:Potassium transporter [Dimargaris verticillata]|uniref:Potassium transporter n=1 Tax=Dimargaris verticillata TaxID=2761393 RepID=A0A9W8B0L2_9FUNG|nr:Potassium transporter [Dimargaris verticillata]
MCYHAAKWKREVINDHKFEYVDVKDFVKKDWRTRLSYLWVFIRVMKATLVYIADLWTAISFAVLAQMYTDASSLYTKNEIKGLDFYKLRWIFWASVLLSFALLAWEYRKSRRILASNDIAYAYTSPFVYRYLCLISYAHFCFFGEIDKRRKTKDNMAFFVFFSLKSWKRVLFAEAPRQVINGLFLVYNFIRVYNENNGFPSDPYKYADTKLQMMSMGVMAFTVIIFVISSFIILAACVLYVPLVLDIRGNLKEYCCHKVDKRIASILRKYSQQKILKARELGRNVAGDFKDDFDDPDSNHGALPQPTLPQVNFMARASLSLETPTHSAQDLLRGRSTYQQPYHRDSSVSGQSMLTDDMSANSPGPGNGGQAMATSALLPGHPSALARSVSSLNHRHNPRTQLADLAYNAGRQPTLPRLDYVLQIPDAANHSFSDSDSENGNLSHPPPNRIVRDTTRLSQALPEIYASGLEGAPGPPPVPAQWHPPPHHAVDTYNQYSSYSAYDRPGDGDNARRMPPPTRHPNLPPHSSRPPELSSNPPYQP